MGDVRFTVEFEINLPAIHTTEYEALYQEARGWASRHDSTQAVELISELVIDTYLSGDLSRLKGVKIAQRIIRHKE
jgi:hypothetical protein